MDGPNEDARRADERRVLAQDLIEARFEQTPSQARPLTPTLCLNEERVQEFGQPSSGCAGPHRC